MTAKRVKFMKDLLSFSGIKPERLRLEWVSSAEGPKFAEVMNEFVNQVKELGSSPLRDPNGSEVRVSAN